MRNHRVSAIAVFALVVVFSMLPGAVSAHHSRAGVYEPNGKNITMKGVVTEWRWRYPHVFLVWNAKDDKGTVVAWTGELSSVTSMQSEGLDRNTFKAGQEVTLTVSPARSGAPQSQLLKVVMADGKAPIDRLGQNIPD